MRIHTYWESCGECKPGLALLFKTRKVLAPLFPKGTKVASRLSLRQIESDRIPD